MRGEDQLADGATYVRGHSNTRSANVGEILALVERARGAPRFPITLGIGLLACIRRVDRVAEILDRRSGHEEQRYLEPPLKEKASSLPNYVPLVLFGDRVMPTAEDRAARAAVLGATLARARKSCSARSPKRCSVDHPRSRGEDRSISSSPPTSSGPPP